jgi:HD domain
MLGAGSPDRRYRFEMLPRDPYDGAHDTSKRLADRYGHAVRDFGGSPVEVRLAEIIALFALGQDNAFGQPMGAQLRSCVLTAGLAEAIGLSAADRDTSYWVSLLRYIGCTGHAHEVAAVFGDDIETRARSVSRDLSDPRQLLPEIFGRAGTGAVGLRRVRAVLAMLAGGQRYVTMNFRTGCDVGDALLQRLGMSDPVHDALRHTFEQWNGKGFPDGVRGTAIPVPMRLVRLCHDAEALDRIHGHDEALTIVRRRSGRLYDPDIVATFTAVGHQLLTSTSSTHGTQVWRWNQNRRPRWWTRNSTARWSWRPISST